MFEIFLTCKTISCLHSTRVCAIIMKVWLQALALRSQLGMLAGDLFLTPF